MSSPVPLSIPDDLLQEVATAAADTGLSKQDVMRQSMKLGLPKLVKSLKTKSGRTPLSKAEARTAFAADPEWDRLESVMARRRIRKPEAD